jgi:hypothetical protein
LGIISAKTLEGMRRSFSLTIRSAKGFEKTVRFVKIIIVDKRLIPAAGISLFARGFRTPTTAGLEGLWFALSARGTWEEKKITDPDF